MAKPASILEGVAAAAAFASAVYAGIQAGSAQDQAKIAEQQAKIAEQQVKLAREQAAVSLAANAFEGFIRLWLEDRNGHACPAFVFMAFQGENEKIFRRKPKPDLPPIEKASSRSAQTFGALAGVGAIYGNSNSIDITWDDNLVRALDLCHPLTEDQRADILEKRKEGDETWKGPLPRKLYGETRTTADIHANIFEVSFMMVKLNNNSAVCDALPDPGYVGEYAHLVGRKLPAPCSSSEGPRNASDKLQ